jgi:hypothetical protein
MLPPEDREPGTQPNGLPWPSGSPQAEAAGSAGNDSLKAIGVVDASNEKYDGVEVLSYTLNKEFTVKSLC